MDEDPDVSPLCDEAHLQVFALWYSLGGMNQPLTPQECADMPATLAKDFMYLIRRIRSLEPVPVPEF